MAAYRGMAKNMFDGGNVTFEDPTVAVDLYAYRPPWMEEIKKVDRHTDRAGGVSFVITRAHSDCLRHRTELRIAQCLARRTGDKEVFSTRELIGRQNGCGAILQPHETTSGLPGDDESQQIHQYSLRRRDPHPPQQIRMTPRGFNLRDSVAPSALGR
ncbi:uncharacterized protein [Physcomitrium patens]|uniref:uncharacterized protein isoform X1 n=1 Tax=Physcomitrium patens TaxID=3218 RepID=UPI00024B0ED9|nr:uncharacterized protein LOC112278052 isoform X1 [Physcomitrium patens]|eukprot:XP_024366830.1 uncharacterized protein LOC112278052 isoform X1 [Physcomitrella patens]